MADGPEAGLAIADGLLTEKALAGYHLLPALRGDLLAKLGGTEEARAEFPRAASPTRNQRVAGGARGPRCRSRWTAFRLKVSHRARLRHLQVMRGPFHDGELEMQRRHGVLEQAEAVGRIIASLRGYLGHLAKEGA